MNQNLCGVLIKDHGNCLWCVSVDNPFHPLNIVSHFGVDPREVWVCTADTPGDNAFKEAVADEGPTRITLWITKSNQ